MKKIVILLTTVVFFYSCKKNNEIQVAEPVFDNYAKVLRITEVSRDLITVKNNTGATINLQEYFYSNGDTAANLAKFNLPHQDSYVVATAMELDFTADTITLYKVDFNTLDTSVSDRFYPVGIHGF